MSKKTDLQEKFDKTLPDKMTIEDLKWIEENGDYPYNRMASEILYGKYDELKGEYIVGRIL